MPSRKLTAEEIARLAAEESSRRPLYPEPEAGQLVAFCLGALDEPAVKALVRASSAVDSIRYRLTEAFRIVRELEAGTIVLNPEPFAREIVEAWTLSRAKPRHNIAPDSRPFVGREVEQARLREALVEGRTRLVALVGAGGMGKSRLARKVALENLDRFPDGVWQLDCALFAKPADMYGAIAKCLGLESADSALPALASKRLLLILDGLEKAPSLRKELPRLLEANGVQVLTTSHAKTRLPGETVYRLAPMKKEGAAVDLFVAAARQVMRDFQLTARNTLQVQTLCKRLMGVPLALTIAAGCLAQQDVPDLLRTYDSGAPAAPSMRQSIVQSFRLLSVQDRQNLRRLGVFAGPFTVADAEAVLGGHLQAVLSNLELRGLLEPGEGGTYRLLDSVGDYLAEIAPDAGEQAALDACLVRHTAHYARRATEIGALMAKGQWALGTAELGRSNANVRQAIRQAVRANDPVALTQLADGISRTYFEAGYLADFEALTNAASRLGDDALRIRLLGLQGALASLRGDEAACERLWKRRLRLAKREGDVYAIADSLTDLAWQRVELDDVPKALDYLDEALTRSEQAEIWELVATAHVIRARIFARTGDTDSARRWMVETEETLPKCDVRELLLFVYQSMGIVYKALGVEQAETAAVVKLLREATEGQRAVLSGWALRELGPLFERQGRLDLAAQCFVAAVAVHNEYATRHRQRAEEAYAAFRERNPAVPVSDLESQPWETIVREVVAATDFLGS